MNRARRAAHRYRRLILIAGIVYAVVAVAWLMLPIVDGYFDVVPLDAAGLDGTPGSL